MVQIIKQSLFLTVQHYLSVGGVQVLIVAVVVSTTHLRSTTAGATTAGAATAGAATAGDTTAGATTDRATIAASLWVRARQHTRESQHQNLPNICNEEMAVHIRKMYGT